MTLIRLTTPDETRILRAWFTPQLAEIRNTLLADWHDHLTGLPQPVIPAWVADNHDWIFTRLEEWDAVIQPWTIQGGNDVHIAIWPRPLHPDACLAAHTNLTTFLTTPPDNHPVGPGEPPTVEKVRQISQQIHTRIRTHIQAQCPHDDLETRWAHLQHHGNLIEDITSAVALPVDNDPAFPLFYILTHPADDHYNRHHPQPPALTHTTNAGASPTINTGVFLLCKSASQGSCLCARNPSTVSTPHNQ